MASDLTRVWRLVLTRMMRLIAEAARPSLLVLALAPSGALLEATWSQGRASAQDAARAPSEPELSLTWPARSDCPERAWVLARIEAQLARPLGRARTTLVAHARIDERGGTYVLSLDTAHGDNRGSRRFEARRCDEVSQAAALVLALSIHATWAEQQDEAAIAEVPSPPAREPADDPSASLTAPERGVTRRSRARPTRYATRAGALVERGLLPRIGVGVELSGTASWRRSHLELTGLWLPPVRSAASPDGARVDVSLFAARAGYCHTLVGSRPPRPRVQLFGCAGLELGRASGQGVGLARPEHRVSLWSAAALSLRLSTRLYRRFGLYLEPALALPFLRRQFVSSDAQGRRVAILHTPQRTSKRVGVGLELFF